MNGQLKIPDSEIIFQECPDISNLGKIGAYQVAFESAHLGGFMFLKLDSSACYC
jgi:hypothetical protein